MEETKLPFIRMVIAPELGSRDAGCDSAWGIPIMMTTKQGGAN